MSTVEKNCLLLLIVKNDFVIVMKFVIDIIVSCRDISEE